MAMYSGGPSLCSNTCQVVDTVQLALMVTSYIAVYLVGYYLAIVQSHVLFHTLVVLMAVQIHTWYKNYPNSEPRYPQAAH